MAISRIQAVSANAASVAITSTTADDLIVVWAYSTSTTIPSLPAGFTSIVGTAGTQQAARLGWKKSTGGDTTSGTWTNAANVVCMVFRGQHLTAPFGTTPTLGAGNSASLSYSAVTLTVTNGSSVVLGFGGAKGATAGMNGNPGAGAVLTTRTNQTTVNGCDSAARATNMTAQTLAVTTSGRWHTVTVELKALALQQLTIPIDEGFYALSGTAIGLLWGQRAIALPSGSYALSGGGAGLNDGDPVTNWLDNSGNGHTATTHSGNATPIFKTNIINGKPVVRFDAASGQMLEITTPISGAAPWTVFHVMKCTNTTTFMAGLAMTGAGGFPTPEDNTFGPYHHLTGFYISAGTMWQGSGPTFSGFNIYAGVVTNLSTAALYKDGSIDVALTIISSGATTAGNFDNIGRRNANYSTGDLAEVIAYNVVLSSTDRANIEKYLADKYGLTVAGGTAVDPSTVSGLQMWFKADSLAGGGVQFLKGKSMPLAQGAYIYTGQTTGVNWNQRVVGIPSGTFVLTGQALNTLFGHRLIVDSGGAGAITGDILTETFDNTTDYDNAGWTVSGTVNPNYTGTVLEGTQSLLVNGTSGTSTISRTYSARSSIYVYFQMRLPTLPADNNQVASLLDSAFGNYLLRFFVHTSGSVFLLSSSSYSGQSVGTLAANTTYHVWLKYVKGTGANAFNSAAFSTDGIRPTSGNNYVEITDSTVTADAVAVYLEAQAVGAVSVIFDRLALNSTQIGDAGAGGPTYSLTGQAVTLTKTGAAAVLTAVQGAYALTGQAVNLLRTRIMPLAQSTYALTGQAQNLLLGRRIPIVQGAYALTGQASTFLWKHIVVLTQGAYALTGQVLNFKRTRIMPLVQGAYALTGQAVSFLKGRIMTLVNGAYALTGQLTNLLRKRTATIVQGAYALTGFAQNLLQKRTVTLVQGAYSLNGQTLNLRQARKIPILFGAYTLSGQPVTLFKTTVGAFTIPLAQGGYVLTGQPVLFPRSRKVVLPQGAYSYSGQPVNLKTGKGVVLVQGFYTLSGQPVSFSTAHKMPLAAGSFVLTGNPVVFARPRILSIGNGVYLLTGHDLILISSAQETWIHYANQVTGSALLVTAAASGLLVPVVGSAFTVIVSTGTNDGVAVATWPDSSGNGFDAAGVVTRQPLYKRNILNGRSVMRFDGSDDYLVTSNAATAEITTAATILIVQKTRVVQSSVAFMAWQLSPDRRIGIHLPWSDNNIYWDFGDAAGGSGRISVPWGGNTTDFFVWSFRAGGGIMEVWRNGTNIASVSGKTTNFPVGGTLPFQIGGASGLAYQNVDMAEVIVFNAAVSDTDRANMEKFLGDYYGLTVAGGTAVDPSTIAGLRCRWKADSLLGSNLNATAGSAIAFSVANSDLKVEKSEVDHG